ncbi:hypothetical protein GCM10010168_88690 [Actinoplanes ianthinogenes]|uniref:Uncharacterized protein n=1 Tax=Actinoplanes ianthinogenes TaxID=122358 RepID=A0ABM7LRW8_9ACTN|nr:hypothetical protein Aiant_26300 [Actinoplanes ianthinogenes]GGR55959.1 hypothetical protein GCM10010168_88690 [Actinoplanes ianthinogenes]
MYDFDPVTARWSIRSSPQPGLFCPPATRKLGPRPAAAPASWSRPAAVPTCWSWLVAAIRIRRSCSTERTPGSAASRRAWTAVISAANPGIPRKLCNTLPVPRLCILAPSTRFFKVTMYRPGKAPGAPIPITVPIADAGDGPTRAAEAATAEVTKAPRDHLRMPAKSATPTRA